MSISAKPFLAFFLLCPLIASCGREEEIASSDSVAVATAPSDALSISVEGVTGGHTRAVWSKHQNPDGSDTYINGESHHLMGFDSRDGKGTRVIIGKKRNFGRPLLSPDGKFVIFTDKQIVRDSKKRKKYDPVVRLVSFDDSESYKLAAGYAADIWRDPKTGIDWVYAVRDLKTTDQGAIEAKTLVRFQLLKPYEEELVWDRTPICPDNLQFSRDGSRACAQFPWPTGGYLDVVKGDWEKLGHGCWTSYSPDDSHIAWVFDGPHRGAAMFSTKTGHRWKLDFTGAPGTEGHELYHPRWSNDPRIITLTGPYKGVEGRDIQVTKGGRHANAFIGRLDPGLERIEAWAALTDDDLGDFYPDVWVEGGETRSLDLSAVPKLSASSGTVVASLTAGATGVWPLADAASTPLFEWRNRGSKNEIQLADGKTRVCSLQLHGLARFGRFQEARLRGGWAVPDNDSMGAFHHALGVRLGLEAVLTAGNVQGTGGSLIQLRRWHVVREGSQALLRDLAIGRVAPLGELGPGQSRHLALAVGDDGYAWAWWNGQPVELNWAPRPRDDRGLAAVMFGDSSDLSLESVAAFGLPRDHVWQNQVVAQSSATALAALEGRAAVEQIRLLARLVGTTPIPSYESIKPYTRALVSYAYETIEVLEGTLDAERIVVQQWGLMDKAIVPGMPGEIGSVRELTIEPLESHPELEGERAEDDILDFASPTFYEVYR